MTLPLLLGGCGEKSSSEGSESPSENQTATSEEVDPDEPIAGNEPAAAVSVSPNFECEIQGGTVTITGCDKNVSGALIIPVTIEGKSVTGIGKYAFSRCTSLTNIIIPDGLTSIGERAFSSCMKLLAIEVGAGNISYADVDGVLFNKKKTVLVTYPKGKEGTNYEVPDGVATIGVAAFYECRNLRSISISDGATAIGEEAFHGCSSLTNIAIPDSVTRIGDYAFVHCTSLRSIAIPAAVEVIRNGVFDNCTSLTKLIFLGDAPEDKTGLINTFPTIYRNPESKGWDDKWSRRPVELISEKP